MHLQISLQLEHETAIPLNHQHFLTAVVYTFIEYSNADYAAFLHGEGYAALENDARRFKLFCFSPIRSQRRRIVGDNLVLGAGQAEWIVSSPLEQFLTEFASGLLSSGHLRVGSAILPISSVETLPSPNIEDSNQTPLRFKCLSPIVAAVAEKNDDKTWTRYLRPKDPDFSDRVRNNLLLKYRALHGHMPSDDKFLLHFDQDYLQKNRGTKLIRYKDTDVIGAFSPFTLATSPELLQLALDCGLGEKNAGGFGMVEKMS
jgi:CRISPR-associated endoribonuclease Cas6